MRTVKQLIPVSGDWWCAVRTGSGSEAPRYAARRVVAWALVEEDEEIPKDELSFDSDVLPVVVLHATPQLLEYDEHFGVGCGINEAHDIGFMAVEALSRGATK